MHDDVHLASLLFVYGLLRGNCGYQTDRKIYDQSEIAARLRSSRNPRNPRNYTLAPRELIFTLLFPYFIASTRDHSSICNGRSRQLKNTYRYICLPFPCYCLTSVCISTSVWKPLTNPQLLVCRRLSPQWGWCWGSWSYRTWKLPTLSLFMYSR